MQTGNYPPNWDEIATTIKNQAGWRCEHCAHPHDIAAGYMLTVHHLDMNPANCAYENLVALCQRCHLSIQARYRPGQTVMAFAQRDWMKKRGLV